ncbi:hypothetical protein PAECIP111893_01403 [Paenibacillus plantiphilus]|uniref:Uncharacterized protein n=1 Tax=Paenibacillus plantiphilus TaxID=2905650 RepID=A0ABN8G5T2_9BACL|nr:hypothetical protein PAECIP111893_01403 [Paenibacillus plantiphilus]
MSLTYMILQLARGVVPRSLTFGATPSLSRFLLKGWRLNAIPLC